jgi:hypothetical protein
MSLGILNKINHHAEVKRLLADLRSKGFSVLRRQLPVRKARWYGFRVEFAGVKIDYAVVFNNLNPATQVESCLAVNNKTFWNKVGPVGTVKFDMSTEDFELLLAGAMYDKVPTKELYNDPKSISFVVRQGANGQLEVAQAEEF